MQNMYLDQIHRCFACGYCKFTDDFIEVNCPSYRRFLFETYFTGGRLRLIYAWLKGEVKWSERLANIVYTCTTCRSCVERCPMRFSQDIVNMIVASRNEAVERGLAPQKIKSFFENVYRYSNPYGEPPWRREWIKDTGVEEYKPNSEYLYYVGCVGSYDYTAQRAAKSLGYLLLKAELSFGALGEREVCDGNEVKYLGEQGLFQFLAGKNIKTFKELGVKKIIVLSPHSYNVMRNEYPKLGGDFKVFHYTQILRDLIRDGKLEPLGFNARITYHDPCFLGRYNNEYDAPREILKSIPGVKLIEMKTSRVDSFCCGGGSGNFYTDILDGTENRPARIRIREAYETGADILAVACPVCMVMLEDALKAENLEGKIMIKDISEIVKESLK